MTEAICVEINEVFYESCADAGRVFGCNHKTIKRKCLSNDFPNYEIVPFRITYTKKKCNKCGKVKLLKKFPIERSSKDNRATKCKKCCKIREDEWRKKNSEHLKEYWANYYKDNIECIKECREQPEFKIKKNKRSRERRKTDIAYKINTTMRNSINHSLRGRKNGAHWDDLVGYTCKELIAHLENLFTDGMSWDNWGHGKYKWNLDHIIAIYWWDITSYDCQEFKDCCALDNLQPLWQVRNFEKGTKPMEPKYLIKPDWIK